MSKLTREEYEAKRQARLDRWRALATKADTQSAGAWQTAHNMASVIPFGQPILVGHHSEKRDRNYRARIDNQHRKGYELHQKAEYYRSRIEAAEKNTTVFSDDPAAEEKLADKIQRLEERQALMKAANKLVRKNDLEGLADLGFSEAVISGLFTKDFAGRLGFPDYLITNNGANIRRLKERVQIIQAHANDETTEKEISGIRIIDNAEDSRLQIFFKGKPSEEVRKDLKSSGFRWSPSNGCWQAYRGNHSNYKAEQIINKHYGSVS